MNYFIDHLRLIWEQYRMQGATSSTRISQSTHFSRGVRLGERILEVKFYKYS